MPLAALLAVMPVGPAGADHGGALKGIRGPEWRIFYSQLADMTEHAVNRTRQTDLDPTDINTVRAASRDQADITVLDDEYPVHWYGYYNCQSARRDGTCARARIRINRRPFRLLGGQRMNDHQTQSVVCEEFGHAATLDHRGEHADTCMNDPTSSFPTSFDDHDRNEINRRY